MLRTFTWLKVVARLCYLLLKFATSVFTHDEGGRLYVCGASSRMTFVCVVLCANALSAFSPLVVSFRLISVVPL